MLNPHESLRQFENAHRMGTVTDTKSADGLLLAKVKINDRETDWLPVQTICNSFMQVFIPVLVGEQVAVFSEFGNADNGIILRSFAWQQQPAPKGNLDQAIVRFRDGTQFTYDVKQKKASFLCAGEMFIEAEGVTFDAPVTMRSALQVDGDINTDGEVSDAMGNLTYFTTTDGASRA